MNGQITREELSKSLDNEILYTSEPEKFIDVFRNSGLDEIFADKGTQTKISTELVSVQQSLTLNTARLILLEHMVMNNNFFVPVIADTGEVITDDSDNAILAEWSYMIREGV